MSKNVLIISTSLKKNANSEFVAHETQHEANDSGHNVEFVTLNDKEIKLRNYEISTIFTIISYVN